MSNLEVVNMDVESAKGYLFYKAVQRSGLENIRPLGKNKDVEAGFKFDPETSILAFYYEDDDSRSSRCVAVILERRAVSSIYTAVVPERRAM
jgi:hypothetical protein